MQTSQSVINYRIKLTVAVYKEKKLIYRNDMTVPTSYSRRSESRAHVKKEIRNRLRHSNFFISPRIDFDLVRYTQEASCNTYLRYRIIEEVEKTEEKEGLPSFSLQKEGSIPLNKKQEIDKILD